ncbi:MAG: hypothetical protein AB1714_13685 [Acidobacteriota bacterium]
MPASAKEFLSIVKTSLAPAGGRAWDVNAISQKVIDSWIQRNVPTRTWGETLRSQLHEHLTEALRDDPTFQALLQKLVRERMP